MACLLLQGCVVVVAAVAADFYCVLMVYGCLGECVPAANCCCPVRRAKRKILAALRQYFPDLFGTSHRTATICSQHAFLVDVS
jgi:hypothetical protein